MVMAAKYLLFCNEENVNYEVPRGPCSQSGPNTYPALPLSPFGPHARVPVQSARSDDGVRCWLLIVVVVLPCGCSLCCLVLPSSSQFSFCRRRRRPSPLCGVGLVSVRAVVLDGECLHGVCTCCCPRQMLLSPGFPPDN